MKFLIIPVVLLSFITMSFINPAGKLPGSGVVWKSEVVDLGKIPLGKPVSVEFEFTNKGKDAVIIKSVTTSCGCTVADYSKKPILSDEKSIIKATYNAGNVGAFTKAITVNFENEETKVLNIKGTVVQQ